MKEKSGNLNNHKDLIVWKKAMSLVEILYKITDNFPNNEMYELVNQIRRAAVSIPSNIAEGAARKSNNEFAHFLYVALGSLAELETQLLIAKRLKYINDIKEMKLIEIRKMLLGLIKKVESN